MLVGQISARDPRPVDPVAVERELQNQIALGTCRGGQDQHRMKEWIKGQFRLPRTVHEMFTGARPPGTTRICGFGRIR